MRFILMACAVVGLFGSSAALAQQPEDTKAKTAKQLSTFAYPGSKEFGNYNTSGLIAQANYSTDDDLGKVDAWYRKKLNIDKDDQAGTSVIDGRLQSLFEDGHRPKADKGVTTRKHATLVHFLKTSEFTMVVVLNRLESDRQTVISLTYVPERQNP